MKSHHSMHIKKQKLKYKKLNINNVLFSERMKEYILILIMWTNKSCFRKFKIEKHSFYGGLKNYKSLLLKKNPEPEKSIVWCYQNKYYPLQPNEGIFKKQGLLHNPYENEVFIL